MKDSNWKDKKEEQEQKEQIKPITYDFIYKIDESDYNTIVRKL